MRASQRGNALFRAGVQPLRQPRAPTSRQITMKSPQKWLKIASKWLKIASKLPQNGSESSEERSAG